MEVVAHHLQVTALARADAGERDLFGRSSYNRYYYAAFLCARTLMGHLRTEWQTLPHATYPEVLEGQIKKELQEGVRRARKLNDVELLSQCSRAKTAAQELAGLMKSSYVTRKIADYHPEVPVKFVHADRFSLNNIDISDAHQWPERARAWASEIQKAWNQLHA